MYASGFTRRPLLYTAGVLFGAAAITFTALPANAASGSAPPTAPVIETAYGYQCLEIDVWFTRSTDSVTPQQDLMYRIYADGSFIGWSDDHGNWPDIWAVAYGTHPGPTQITVTAVDAAGNESAPSNAVTVTADDTC